MTSKKKILLTGGNGMLAYDFIRTGWEKFDIVAVDREECDITSFESVIQCLALHEPDILLNCAAYTTVDDAENIGMKVCYEVNALGAHNLARATSAFGTEFITISTDYVFDGEKSEGYFPSDACNPIGAYGMSKYLGEKLALSENPRTIIVRTSWLYWWELWIINDKLWMQEQRKAWVFKNFVNTMLRLSESKSELRVVSDQHWTPTSCVDLSQALVEVIENIEEREYEGKIFHFSNSCREGSVTWADFAREIFQLTWKDTNVIGCNSSEYPTKAKRPSWSILKNDSEIMLPDWKQWLKQYLKN